ncbi:MAG: FapA family protein [Cellulosilyticum sp.]|nr:FapA family protein [Cellulosilyticum sp.]
MSADNEQIRESVIIEVTTDKMLGIITFIEPKNGGEGISLEEVKTAIKDKGIIQGIKEDDLIELCESHRYNYKYVIAQGTQPIQGKDGYIEFAFDVESLKQFKPRLNDDGTVDLKDLGVVKNVKKGERLATRIPAVQGQDGCNVLGQPVRPKRAKEARMPKGRNTRILEDNVTLVSDIDGKLEYDDHNIYINSVYTISGDLDSSIGNIDFVGSVVINGSIHSGYSVKAGGSVEVRGPVDDAVIIAGEDIILSYGIQGTEKSKLVARGNVIAKFIQNANVEAGKSVITEAVLHSTVTAGDSIRTEMGKGTIVGGSVSATNTIIAKSIGSLMGTVTEVKIGVSPSVYAEHRKLAEEVKEKKASLNKVDQSIAFLMSKNMGGRLDPQKQLMLKKFNATRQPILEEYETLRVRYEQLSERLENVQEGLIKCSGAIYPGVKVMFGNLIRYIDDKEVKVTIRKKDGDIHIGV